ncbi:MAG: hypothetical protein JWQ06_1529 [Mucilaginibacter sp.]|nr:hypothetical protein [Mucilaginibacter sp.]
MTNTVVEQYHTIIEKDREIKQGLYQALYRKTIIASGMFTNDKKTGVWHFYNNKGQSFENYNYDTNNLLGEAPEDSTSNFRYTIDDTFKPGDRITKPIKVGGRYFGYLPYLKLFKIPADMANINRELYIAVLELLISPGGRLAEYKIHLKSGDYDRIIHINPDLLSEEDKQFIPATINGKAITSNIFVHCYITDDDDIDM